MLDRSSASRYAQALFELAREGRSDAVVEDALVVLSEALQQSPDTERRLMDPRIGLEDKRRIFSKVLSGVEPQTADLLLNFFSVLFEKHRFNLIHDIAEAFKIISDQAQGESVALVRTAQALDAATQARLLSVLEKTTGTKVAMKTQVDPAVLGGVEVRIGNRLMDGSIRGKIARLKETLLRA